MLTRQQPSPLVSPPGASQSDWARDLEARAQAFVRARTAEDRHRCRQSGYVGAVVINAILLVIVHSLPGWSIPFLTPAWADVLWALDLSLSGTIVANAVFVVYDEAWFHDLAEIVVTALALVAWLTLVQVFPFDFGDPGATQLARLVGLLVTLALSIALLVQAIGWIVDRVRQAVR